MKQLSLIEKLKHLPSLPGVYKLIGKGGEILYIGKAKVLKNRVRSYFQKKMDRLLTNHLSAKIKDIDLIITRNEKEALILENNLIKEHQPYFNINLKDNKTYPFLKLTTEDKFPRLIKTREHSGRGEYFGPYTDLGVMYRYKDMLNNIFPLKKCRQQSFPKGFKPCLYFHIGKCLPYCTGKVTQKEIARLTHQVKTVLNGKVQEIQKELEDKMHEVSAKENFELALKLRDQINALEKIGERQQAAFHHQDNMDVVHYHLCDKLIIFSILNFRKGKLIDKKAFHFENELLGLQSDEPEFNDYLSSLFRSFLLQFYSDFPPPAICEVLIPLEIGNRDELEEIIIDEIYRKNEMKRDATKLKFEISTPLKGERRHLLDLAKSNARLSFHELIQSREKKKYAQFLKELIQLKKPPVIIESFDIANTANRAIVAGMVCFKHGKPDKENYRIFNIKESKGQDDFASLEEAVYRRYKRLLDEAQDFPDLILIDGGKGQLRAALKSLHRLGVKGQPIVSLAKREEALYVPKLDDPLKVDWKHPGLTFLIEVRDETHRFANSSHIRKRDRDALKSTLESIPGLGKKKIQLLFQHFDSLRDIMFASKEEILSLAFFGEKDFHALQSYFASKASKTTRLIENDHLS